MYLISKYNIIVIFTFSIVLMRPITTLKFILEIENNSIKTPNINLKSRNNISVTIIDVLLNILNDINNIFVDISDQNDSNEEFFDFFLKQTITPIFTTIDCYPNRNMNNSYGIVTSLKKLIESKCDFYKSGVYFFIMSSDNVYEFKIISEMLQELWKYYEIHKIYIITTEDIKIYYPFEIELNSDTKFIKWGKLLSFMSSNDLDYRRNILKNLNEYPLRMQIFRSVLSEPKLNETTKKIITCRGTDAQVMFLLRDKMNFTIILQEPDQNYFGVKFPNGTFSGGIGLLIRNEADAVLTSYFIKDYNTREVEYTVGVYDDRLCIFVPKAERIPPSILPLFSVGYDMWILYVFVAFSSGTILSLLYWAYLINLNFKICGMKEVFQIYIDTWIVWVRVGLIKLPEFQSGRIFILSVSMVSVIFGAIFESSLATVYTKPLYYPDINTLQQLANRDFKILYKYESMKDDLFPKNVSATYDFLDNKMVLVDKKENLMLKMIKYKNFGSVNRWLGLQLFDSVYFSRKILHIVPECPKLYMLSYILQKNSPFAERINNLLLDFVAAGLLDQWTEQMKYKESISHLKDPYFEENSSVKVLSLRDLQLSFYVLFIGCLLAGFVLILEIIKKRYELQNNKNSNRKIRNEQQKVQIIIEVKK